MMKRTNLVIVLQRRTALEISVLVITLFLVLSVYAYTYTQGTQQVNQTILNVYSGVETVQVTGSIPNEMDKDQIGFFGAIFWNPTKSLFQIMRVEFNSSTATNQVFNGIEQGTGKSYPTSGWALDAGKKVVYLTSSLTVNPHAAQEFFVRIDANLKAETFNVAIRVTANGTVYEKSYSTVQNSVDSPLSVLWLGTGTSPQYVVPVIRGQQTIFYVSLQEDSNKIGIGSNGKLTINLPAEFTSIQNVGGTGWGTPTIIGSKIEVNNTVTVKESYITYAFRAIAPIYKGLYMLNVSFTGTPNEKPIGNFSVKVVDVSERLLYVDGLDGSYLQWTEVGSSPYLGAIDYPSNYIHTTSSGAQEGWFSFQDMTDEVVSNVTLDIYGWTARSGDQIYVSLWDGSQSNAFYVQLPVSPGWASINVTSILDTQNKVNAAMLWIYWYALDNNGHGYIDSARLRVNGYTAP